VTAAGETIGRLVEAAREADTDIRESISGLRESLSEGGFFAALAKYLCQYEKNCAIRVALEKPEGISDAVFEPIVAVQLLRILQEALTNVRKHANAQRVHIRFALENDGGPRQWACVIVRDDGCGFDASALSDKSGGHFGLRVMQERVEAVGGQFTLHAQPGRGTTVVIRVPVRLAGDTEPQMRKIEHG
ncbi:MAG TPA: ATP-binding protein, partial [Moraxellaceae bacterium]|nr:ATP-binding protein [Moraxellaceae bacterium]